MSDTSLTGQAGADRFPESRTPATAEAALVDTRQAIERERDILQAVMNGANTSHLVYLDRDFNFVRVNETYARTCGYRPAEMIGKNHFALYPHAENEAIFTHVRDTGEPYSVHDKPFEFPDQPDRGITYWDWTLTPVKDVGGAVIGLVFSLFETTERKRAEEQLQESEHRFRAFMDNAPTIAWMKDEQFRYVYVSGQAERMTGLGLADYRGKTDFDLWPPEIAENFQKNDRAVLDRGANMAGVEELLDSDGERHFILNTKFLFQDAQGRRFIGGVGVDITERMKVEAQLKASEERFRSVMELSPDIISIITEEGVLAYNSPAALTIHGYANEEMAGRNTFELIHPDDQAQCLAFTTAHFNHLPDPRSVQYRYRNKDGSYVWMEATASNQLDNPHIRGLVVISRDISERKQAEGALAEAKQAAEIASRAKSEFLANMSHEIRTPITGILGMAELLESTELSAQQQRYLENILSSTENLLQLVNDILDLSKIEAGKVELEHHEFSLRRLINQVIGNQITLAQVKGLSIRTGIPADIPDRLTGDQLRLKQILLNLIGNAIKFTEQGEVAFSVTAEEQEESRILLRFDVTDTGIGIKPEDLAKIFTPFGQADSSMTRRFGGSGLGLTICRQLSTLMNGEIWVDSVEAAGSTFHVRIPFTVNSARETDYELRKIESSPLWEGELLRVLVVEDSEIGRTFFAEVLRKYGHHVDLAGNGVEALEKWRLADYDLVLMDVQMPVMDGIEATGRIREMEKARGGHVPVVAVTAHAMENDLLDLLNRGFDGYLAKPMKISKLFAEMKRCLGQ
jgi:two-component system CheB/CheR fusion protein